MPCPGPFNCSHSVDYIYDFCPLLDPDVDISIFVCDVEHTSFHVGLCGRKFVLGLFVLVLFLEAVVLSRVHVALDIFYQHIVHVYRGVVYKHKFCLSDVHLKTHSPTFIG